MKNLDFEIEANGNLKVILTEVGKETLTDLIESQSEDGIERTWTKDFESIWLDLMEDRLGNSDYEIVSPVKLGALTEAPIIGKAVSYDENGELETDEDDDFWYYGQYMVKDEFSELLNNGFIIFTLS